MTDLNVVVISKDADIIDNESPSLLRAWWMNRKLQYDLAMGSIILILNIAATVYMIVHKIPLSFLLKESIPLLILFAASSEAYLVAGVASCIGWFMAIENASMTTHYYWGRISHTAGFCIFYVLLDSISPHLALRAALPCFLWLVPFMLAPARPSLYKQVQELRDWWKHVNEPRPAIVTKHGETDESRSLLSAWWMNWNLRYDIGMGIVIIILNIATIVYMITHKTPINDSIVPLELWYIPILVYFTAGISSCIAWLEAIEDVSASEFYFLGRITHTTGFCIFLDLLNLISPHLALRAGLPCLLWFVTFMLAPACPPIYTGLCTGVNKLRDWWKHVNQPRPKGVIVKDVSLSFFF